VCSPPWADSLWAVINARGEPVKDGFTSNEAAWSWIDRNTDEGRDDNDRYNRIRDAFAIR
jgi:hypothetical protein